MNVTTLLAPLFALTALARRIIAPTTPYVDLKYRQATSYQAGFVACVVFWAIYGQGFGADNIHSIATFGSAYMLVIVVEPLADLAVLAAGKAIHALRGSAFIERRLYNPA